MDQLWEPLRPGRESRAPSFTGSWLGRRSIDFPRPEDSEDDEDRAARDAAWRGRHTLKVHGGALVVGVAAGCMATCYNLLLRNMIRFLWVWTPRKLGDDTPWWYAIAVCAATGAVVSVLSECMPPTSNVDEWIDSVHRPLRAPSPTTANFWPMIVLTTITAAGGISVGPEAPMVTLGGIMGATFARLAWGRTDAHAIRVMSLAGGGAALSAFFSMPLAGAIFALETPHDGVSGMQYFEALSPAAVASVAALFTRCVMLGEPLRGKYVYELAAASSPLVDLGMALAAGVAGGLMATAMTALFRRVKFGGLAIVAWAGRSARPAPEEPPAPHGSGWCKQDDDGARSARRREMAARLALRVATGALIGMLGVYFPHSLFWGDEQLQSIIDDGQTPLKWLWRSSALDRLAVTPTKGVHISHLGALGLAVAKVCAIALSLGGGFPGGIIYPLFVVGAATARAAQRLVAHSRSPAMTMCMMAATQAAVTRTPISTALILIVTARSFGGLRAERLHEVAVMPVIFPLLVISVVMAMVVSNAITPNRYYERQRQRVGIKLLFAPGEPQQTDRASRESRDADDLSQYAGAYPGSRAGDC